MRARYTTTKRPLCGARGEGKNCLRGRCLRRVFCYLSRECVLHAREGDFLLRLLISICASKQVCNSGPDDSRGRRSNSADSDPAWVQLCKVGIVVARAVGCFFQLLYRTGVELRYGSFFPGDDDPSGKLVE